MPQGWTPVNESPAAGWTPVPEGPGAAPPPVTGDQLLENLKNIAGFGTRHLPDIGGALGGLIGGVGGTVAGMGVGGAPGAIGGAALGGGAGEALKQLIGLLTGTGAPMPPVDAATEIGKQGAIQGGAQAAGAALGAGMSKAGPWMMQKALKPTLSTLKEYRTTPAAIAKTLLDEGVNVTDAGLAKLQRLFGETNDAIKSAVSGADATVSKDIVASHVPSIAAKYVRQVNPTADLEALQQVLSEFADHPAFTGPTLSVQEAHALKQGTYQQIGKKYGQVAPAGIEGQKALARGLKEQVAEKVPGIAALNARDSALMAAQDAVGRRVAVAGNRDPVGFAWVAANPTTFIAALLDRNPAVKSLIARGMYQEAATAAGVTPQLIRMAVSAIASGADDTTTRPANQ